LPRYYFHTDNGHAVRDDLGEELADADAARQAAVTVLGEILRYRGSAFWTSRRFSVIVTDPDGRTIVSVTAAASDVPPDGWRIPESGQ